MSLKRFNFSGAIPELVASNSEALQCNASANEKIVFQADVPAASKVVLQGRISEEFAWIDIVEADGTSVLTSVESAPEYRITVTKPVADTVTVGVIL